MNISKKVLSLSMAAVMAISLAACGGSNEAGGSSSASPTQAPATPSASVSASPESDELSSNRNTTHDADELETILTEAYMGLTENGEAIYYAGDDALENVLLMFYNPESNSHYVFVGPITDNGNGTLTITDQEDGLQLTFEVSEAEGGLLLNMGDLGAALLAESTVEETIQAMLLIESGSSPVIPGSDSAGDETAEIIAAIEASLTEAYVGETEDGMVVYLGTNDDASFTTLVIVESVTSSTIFAGETEIDDDGIATVTDAISGNTLKFALAESDGALYLAIMGLVDEVELQECTVDELIAALSFLVNGAEATD